MSTIINGTSSAITFPDTTVQNTAFTTGAVTQSTIGTNVAGTGPAFRAYQSVQQTGIANTTYTKITLDAETYDTNSNFASSRFTPTVAGYYQINGAVAIPSTTNNNGVAATIFKNGNLYSIGASGMGSVGQLYAASSISDCIYMNGSTDYVELYVYGAQGASFSLVASSSQTYFTGALVRAA